jgi:AcrR family transcriptional regulator
MTEVMDRTETDVRERILVTAERLFREIGYTKTTVADIAKTLRMSPANVYRFFDSKQSITAGVARRLMGEVEEALGASAARPLTASDRLRDMLVTLHQMNTDRYVRDSKMHEMCAVAMEESWEVCEAHINDLVGMLAKVIADGAASGEFQVADVGNAALCVMTAMIRFVHPQMIAECADKPGPSIDQMIDFVMAALRAGGRGETAAG